MDSWFGSIFFKFDWAFPNLVCSSDHSDFNNEYMVVITVIDVLSNFNNECINVHGGE